MMLIKPLSRGAIAAATLSAVALLSACTTVGPNFAEPKFEPVPSYRHADGKGPDAAQMPLDSWT